MPYVIAIVLVAVAALVFFSRPSNTDEAATITTESTPAVESAPEETLNEEAIADDVITWEELTGKERDGSTIETEVDTSANTGGNTAVTEPVETANPVTLSGASTYQTPARQEHEISVTMTLDGNIITAADVLYNGETEAKTPQHRAFEADYATYVIGENISEISLSRIGGASLTTTAFVEAVNKIAAKL